MDIETLGFFRGPNIYLPMGGMLARIYSSSLSSASSSAHPEFCRDLLVRLPGLAGHQGGKLAELLARGLTMQHVFIHVLMELFRSSGFELPKVRLLADGADGFVELFVSALDEKIATQALTTAGDLMAAVENDEFQGMMIIGMDQVDPDSSLARFRRLAGAGSTTGIMPLLTVARERGIPVSRVIDSVKIVQFGQGYKREMLLDSLGSHDSAVRFTDCTSRTELLARLRMAGVPVPDSLLAHGHEQARAAAAQLGYPVTYKPEAFNYLASEGAGSLTLAIADEAELSSVLAEYASATASMSMEKLNAGQRYLSLLLQGELKLTIEFKAAGAARVVTPDVHPDNRRLLRRVSNLLGVDLLGVELIGPSIDRSFREQDMKVHYVYINPQLPAYLQWPGGQELARKIVEQRLFAGGDNGRIPVIACAGRAQSAEILEACRQLALLCNYQPGSASGRDFTVPGDAVSLSVSGAGDAYQAVLQDPAVSMALFDYPFSHVILHGINCDKLDVLLLTALAEDPPMLAEERDSQALTVMLAAAEHIVCAASDFEHLRIAPGDTRWCLYSLTMTATCQRHIDAGGAALIGRGSTDQLQLSYIESSRETRGGSLNIDLLAARWQLLPDQLLAVVATLLQAGVEHDELMANLHALGEQVMH